MKKGLVIVEKVAFIYVMMVHKVLLVNVLINKRKSKKTKIIKKYNSKKTNYSKKKKSVKLPLKAICKDGTISYQNQVKKKIIKVCVPIMVALKQN